MSTDLLRQQSKWKETLMEIRQMMASLIQEGFNSANMKPWRFHWDHQLYKSLEHQYQLGLEALNEHLPEIRVELIYRYMSVFVIFSYGAPLAQRASYLALHSSLFGPDGSVNYYCCINSFVNWLKKYSHAMVHTLTIVESIWPMLQSV